MSTQDVTNFLSILTIVGDVAIVLFVIDWLVSRLQGNKKLTLFAKLWSWIKSRSLTLGFIVALISTVGSLYYSEIAGYAPCKLCWYQRILMYPLVLIFGLAMYFKEKIIYRYTLLMSLIGSLVAGYHYYIQVFAKHTPEGCSAVGYAASCSEHFVLHYGYITIPMMALTAFLLIMMGSLLEGKIVEIKGESAE